MFTELIQTDSLNNILRNISFSDGFLKVEAEGLEPEVLEDGPKQLRNSRYIAIDVTEERFKGDNFISSYEECHEILRRNNSLMVDRTGVSALFQRL